MVTSFGCSCVDGPGAAQSPSCWRSCKVWGKIEEDGIVDRSIVIEVEGAWNLGGMGMLSCMRVGIGVVCVLVLVVVMVVVLVWMWMMLIVWVVVGVLAVLLAMVVATMVGMMVEVGCVGVVLESSGEGFVVVLLKDFGVMLWCGWRMVLWCWNERGDFLRCFSLMSVAENMYVVAGAFLFGMVI